jgi:hypothetical protein
LPSCSPIPAIDLTPSLSSYCWHPRDPHKPLSSLQLKSSLPPQFLLSVNHQNSSLAISVFSLCLPYHNPPSLSIIPIDKRIPRFFLFVFQFCIVYICFFNFFSNITSPLFCYLPPPILLHKLFNFFYSLDLSLSFYPTMDPITFSIPGT